MAEQIILDMSKTYIYEGLEYILTGRTAQKGKPSNVSGRTHSRIGSLKNTQAPIMVEIKPSPKINLNNPLPTSTETLWVKLTDLFMVEDMLNEPEEVPATPDDIDVPVDNAGDDFEEDDDEDY
jgi:hypothetical protein